MLKILYLDGDCNENRGRVIIPLLKLYLIFLNASG